MRLDRIMYLMDNHKDVRIHSKMRPLLKCLTLVVLFCLLFDTPSSWAQYSLDLNIPSETLKKFKEVLKSNQSIIYRSIKKTTSTYPTLVNHSSQILTSSDFQNSIFQDKTLFTLTTFQTDANFQLTDFREEADFSNANFLKNARFSFSEFRKTANFFYTTFGQNAWFYSAIFNDAANFFKARVMGEGRFINSKFFKIANFSNVSFNADTQFQESLFKSDANFEGTEFQKANFSHANFLGSVNFKHAVFKENAIFEGASFNSLVSFENVHLPESLDFSNVVNIKEGIDLTSAIPLEGGKKTNINLVGSNMDKIKLRYEMFNLYFPKDIPEQGVDLVYEKLINSLKQNGLTQDYKRLSIEYAHYRYLRNNQYILNYINKFWWDYGFETSRIYLWIFLFVLIFTFINTAFYDFLVKQAYSIPFLGIYLKDPVIQRNYVTRFIYNLPFAFVYTVTIFFGVLLGFKAKPNYFKSKNFFINLYLLIITSLGFMCTVFMINNIFRGFKG